MARHNLLRGVIPYFHVDGANDAARFYERAFAAKEISRVATDDGKRLMNCQIEINGDLVMVMDAMPDHGYSFEPTHSFSDR
jgi:PhnB protein